MLKKNRFCRMAKKCLLIQPGAYGDIFVCAPIAKIYHDNGYEVHWPVTKKFISLLERFSYVVPILLRDEVLHEDWLRSDVLKCLEYCNTMNFDTILNLADRGPHPTAETSNENFELCKYRLSSIPIEYKHSLTWNRDEDKEKKLFDLVVKDADYALVHLNSSRGDRADLPKHINIPIVEVSEIPGFDIFDWYRVIINAKQIYCIESAIHQFMDGFVGEIKDIPKYLLSRSTLGTLKKYTYSPYWANDYLL